MASWTPDQLPFEVREALRDWGVNVEDPQVDEPDDPELFDYEEAL